MPFAAATPVPTGLSAIPSEVTEEDPELALEPELHEVVPELLLPPPPPPHELRLNASKHTANRVRDFFIRSSLNLGQSGNDLLRLGLYEAQVVELLDSCPEL